MKALMSECQNGSVSRAAKYLYAGTSHAENIDVSIAEIFDGGLEADEPDET
jgi:hypothetical protein